VRKSPPVKVALRVIDSTTPTRVLVDASVELVQLNPNGSKTSLFKGSANQQNNVIIYDKKGKYQVTVSLKSHRQQSHLDPFMIDREKRPSHLWDEPIMITVGMVFECFVRVRVVQEVPIAKPSQHSRRGAKGTPRTKAGGGGGGGGSTKGGSVTSEEETELMDMHQATVSLIASDGTRINLGRPEAKSEGNWRVGKLDLPNTYKFSAQLMNYTQSNLTAPMHFDRNSWMEAETIGMGGSMDFTIHMNLEPRLFVEVVDAQDTNMVLSDVATELVKLGPNGQPLHDVEPGDAITKLDMASGVVIDIPGTYALRATLPNHKQTNFVNPFRLNRSCWPVDRPLKVTLHMELEAVLKVVVIDRETDDKIHGAEITLVENTTGELFYLTTATGGSSAFTAGGAAMGVGAAAAMEADVSACQRIPCPGSYTIRVEKDNFEQASHIGELQVHRQTWPRDGPLEVKVCMNFVGINIDNVGALDLDGRHGQVLGHSKSTLVVTDPLAINKMPTLVALGLGTEQENEVRKKSFKRPTPGHAPVSDNTTFPRMAAE